MRSKIYEINFKPIPWARAGLNRNHFFDKQQEEKVAFGLLINKIHGIDPRFEGPLFVEALFYLEMPKTRQKPATGTPHCKRPDIDNYIKFIFDAITDCGSIWEDDNQIATLVAKKMYGKEPKTVITITELE